MRKNLQGDNNHKTGLTIWFDPHNYKIIVGLWSDQSSRIDAVMLFY